jgi:spore maturation protein CgeB
VRLFEAAACGTPIVSDMWDGIDALLAPDREIVLAEGSERVLDVLDRWPEERRSSLADAARARVLAQHTAAHRAGELEAHLLEARARTNPAAPARTRRSPVAADL